MRKAFPKKNKPIPTGVMNIRGKEVTNPNEKKLDGVGPVYNRPSTD